MSPPHPHLTPEQARQQLEVTQTHALATARDRRVHAIATAVLGSGLAFSMVTRNVLTGAVDLAVSGIWLAVWLGGVFWIEHAAPAVPRRARLWSLLGIGASFVLALALALPWLNLKAQTEPNTWPMVLVAGAVVVAPSLVAAAAIARGRR